MRTSEAGNLPRWGGQPGFFEIWFLVVFQPECRRAWWLRYTTFAPVTGRPGGVRSTLWAAAFDAQGAPPALAVKEVFPAAAYDPGPRERFDIHIGPATLTNDSCRGAVRDADHTITWALDFTPAAYEARRAPRLLDALPLPTRVSHANSDVVFRGWIDVDGARRELVAAPGLQKHIWGTRRVEELYWLYCPRLEGEVQGALEATGVRATRRLPGGIPAPRLTTLWLRTAGGEIDRCELPGILGNTVEPDGPGRLRWRSASPTRVVTVVSWCDVRTLVGYVYRDPAGSDLYVAQSDVASVTVELCGRRHPLAPWKVESRLACRDAAALEFHAPEPLADVRYVSWDPDP